MARESSDRLSSRARRYASAVAAQEGLLLQTGLYSVRMTLNDSNVSLDVQLYLSRNANARAGRGSGAEARMIDDDHLRGFTYSSDSRAGRSASRGRGVGPTGELGTLGVGPSPCARLTLTESEISISGGNTR